MIFKNINLQALQIVHTEDDVISAILTINLQLNLSIHTTNYTIGSNNIWSYLICFIKLECSQYTQ